MSGTTGGMTTVGRYRVTRRLGSGSFATVWLGHDDELDVDVAVKILADNWADNADVRDRFLAEARIMRRVRDDRIVRVYDIGTLPDGRPYFVMDHADSGSLDDLRRQGIPPREALGLCAEASRALHALHAHGVIHRDVTPGNILLHRRATGEMSVVIADLGVAKSMVEMVGATMTAGTPAYMAREQATGVGTLDHRADIYSLAAVTYAMVTGAPPFPIRTLADLLTRDPQETPMPIAQRVGAPPLLDAVLRAALSPQPGRRPRTALELAEVLDQCVAQMSSTSAGIGPATPPAHPLGPPHSVISSWPPSAGGHEQASPHSWPPDGQAPSSWPPQSGPGQTTSPPQAHDQFASGSYGPGSTPPVPYPIQQSLPAEASDEAPQTTNSALFWVLVLVAAIALFTIALLVTIKALG